MLFRRLVKKISANATNLLDSCGGGDIVRQVCYPPDVESHVPSDLIAVGVEEVIPVLLEELLERERAFF